MLPIFISSTNFNNTTVGYFITCFFLFSVYSSNLPPEMKPNNLVKFDAVLSISAIQGTNISLLKDKIRTLIDIYHEEKEMKNKQVTVCTNPEYDVIYV